MKIREIVQAVIRLKVKTTEWGKRWLNCLYRSPKLFIDRIMSQHLIWQLAIIGLGVLVLFGGFWAVNRIFSCVLNEPSISGYELFYSLIDTNAWSDYRTTDPQPKPISFLRIVAYFCAMAIFGGLLISVLTNWFARRIENYQNGITTYLKKGHHVILGYDEIVPSIILDIFKISNTPQRTYILLQSAMPCNQVKELLRRSPASKYLNNIVFNYGHRTSIQDLSKLHLTKAQSIYIVGDRNKPTHDSMNFECLVNIYNIMEPTAPHPSVKLTCVFDDADSLSAFQQVDLVASFQEMQICPVFYNFYTEWARHVLVSEKYGDERELSGRGGLDCKYPQKQGIKYEDENYLHIVIVGINRLGVALGIEAAKIIHYPNFERDRKLKTRISFIDLKADEEMELFMTRYRPFFQVQACQYVNMTKDSNESISIPATKFKGNQANFLDVDFEFIKGDVFSMSIQNLLEKWACEENYLSLYIAFRDQQKGLTLALNLPRKVYDTASAIFVRQTRSDVLFSQLRKNVISYSRTYMSEGQKMVEHHRKSLYANIYPFGMTDVASNVMGQVQIQAEILMLMDRHDNIRHQVLDCDYEQTNWSEIRNLAHKEWNSRNISIDEQNGYFYMACAIPYRLSVLRSMRGLERDDDSLDRQDLSKKEINRLVVTEHNRWNVEKLFSGYQKLEIEESFDVHKQADTRLNIMVVNEQRPYSHDIRAYNNRHDITAKDKEMVALIPRVLRASHPVWRQLSFDDSSGIFKEVEYLESFNEESGRMEQHLLQ